MGAVLAPMSAFLLLQGIETVALRVERHVENGRKVAEFLRDDPRVDWVNYAGFPDSPYHALAQRYLGGQATSLLTFGVKGGLEAGKRFYDRLKIFRRLVNIGDAKSLACHPASTTHRQMTPGRAPKRPASCLRPCGSASASNTSTTSSPISTKPWRHDPDHGHPTPDNGACAR